MIPLWMLVICYILEFGAIAFAVVPLVMGVVQKRRALRPVEYYPPRGYSPIDVMIKYFGTRAKMRELFNPLMLYWAEHGFITIEEDCKRGLKLTKLKQLERVGKKDDFSELTYALEFKLFNEMFSRGDVFYTLAAPKYSNDTYKEFCNDCMRAAEYVKKPICTKLGVMSAVASSALMILFTIVTIASTKNMLLVTMVFPIVAVFFMIAFRMLDDAKIGVLKHLFFAVWGGAPMCVGLFSTRPEYAVLIFIATFLSYLTVHVLYKRIDIRDEESVAVYGRIEAFKTFLIDAEQDRLNTLVEEDPDWFYDILPFCYILKITEKLKPKFDRIMLDGPSWYMGNLRDTLMF